MINNKIKFSLFFLLYALLVVVIFNIEMIFPGIINKSITIKIIAITLFVLVSAFFIFSSRRLFSHYGTDANDATAHLGEKYKENSLENNTGSINYERILNDVDTFVLVVDAKLNPVYINDFGRNKLGDIYGQDNLVIEHFVDENFVDELETNKHDAFDIETTIKVAGKKKIASIASVSKLSDDTGAFSGMIILFNDISKQKRAELSLNNQINFSKQIFKTIPDVILITDMDLRVIFANKKAEEILAANTDESRKIVNYLSQDAIASGFDEYLKQIITRGVSDKQINVQNPFLSEDGFVDIEIVPLISGKKTIGGLLLVKDITEWRNLTEELKNLENFNRKMINSSPYVIVSVNDDDIVTGWNERGEEKFGIKANDIIGNDLFKIFPEISILRDELNEAKIIGEPTFLTDKEIELENGNILAVEITLYPVFSKEKNIVINIRDVSELKKLENSLLHANKMGSLGLLTSKIVHDLNNVLSGITGYTTLLDKKVESSSEIRKYVDRLGASSDRATDIIKQILAFSKTKKKEEELIDVNALIEESAKLLQLRIDNSKISLNLEQQSLIATGNRTRLSQAIMNLLVNSNDALINIEKPEIIISTKIICESKDKSNDKIVISIRDNGTGIKKELLNKIFETYYTTKSEDKGTGLGLSNVKDIIKEMNGEINVESEYGHGTKFILTLPRTNKQIGKENKEDVESSDNKINITGKVLIVDDEETVREIGTEILELLGAKCITAIDGDDGILKFEENIDDLELVILDVEMPKKQGDEVYDFIKSAKPDMKILIASGYSKEYLEKDVFKRIIPEYIAKPFKLKELGDKMREMLGV